MSKKLIDISDKEFTEHAKGLMYLRFYSRWPAVNPEIRNMLVSDLKKMIWEQYAETLDNGKGIVALQNIKALISSELEDIEQKINAFPEDAEQSYKYRLKHNRLLMEHRLSVLERLLTEFAIHGKVNVAPEFKPDENLKAAIRIVCKGRRNDCREILYEFLAIRETDQSLSDKEIHERLESNFEISYSTLNDWVRALDEELKRISHTEK